MPALSVGVGVGINTMRCGRGAFNPDFYADSVNGDDGNDGLTAETAFASLATTEAAALDFGDGAKIGLVSGSTWEGQSLALQSITVSIRIIGSGKLPVIDCRVNVLIEDMSKAAGLTNLYQFNWTPTNGEKVAPSLWEEQAGGGFRRLQRVASQAACDTTPGSYYASPTYAIGVPAPVYFHPTASANPITSGTGYKQSVIYAAIRGGERSDVRYIRTIGQQADDGSVVLGRHSYDEGCIFEDGTKHNSFRGSGRSRNSYAWKADRSFSVFGSTGGIPFIAYNTSGERDALHWDGAKVVLEDDSGSLGGQGGFYNHGSANAFGDVRANDCEAYFTDTMYDGFANCDTATVTGGFSYNAARFLGNSIDPANDTFTASGFEWYVDRSDAAYIGVFRPLTAKARNITFTDFIAVVAGDAAGANNGDVFESRATGSSYTVSLERGLIVADRDLFGSGTHFGLSAIVVQGNTDTWNVNSCLIDGFGYGAQAYGIEVGSGATYFGDGNVWNERQSDSSTSPRLRMKTPDIGAFTSTASAYLAAIDGQSYDEPTSVATVNWQFQGNPVLREYSLAETDQSQELSDIGLNPNPTVDSNIDGYSSDGVSTIAHDAVNGRIDVARNGSGTLAGKQSGKIAVTGMEIGRRYVLIYSATSLSNQVSAHVFENDLLTEMTADLQFNSTNTYTEEFTATTSDGYITLGCRGSTNATVSFDNINVLQILQEERTVSAAFLNGCTPQFVPMYPGKTPREIYDELWAWLESA